MSVLIVYLLVFVMISLMILFVDDHAEDIWCWIFEKCDDISEKIEQYISERSEKVEEKENDEIM